MRVISGNFADHLVGLINEAQSARGLSLWLVDPYGFKDIPYFALRPMMSPPFGPEVLINLDFPDIWRKIGDSKDVADAEEILYHQPDKQTALNALYGGGHWRGALKKGLTCAQSLEALAGRYKERFAGFEYRSARRLRSTDNQVRFLIHFAHSKKELGELQRMLLSEPEVTVACGPGARCQCPGAMRRTTSTRPFRGRVTTIDGLYEASIMPLDLGQLRVVLREAESRGFGEFRERAQTMYWADARRNPEQTVPPRD